MDYTNISAMLPMLCWFLGETARANHHIRSAQHLFGQHVKKTMMEQKESNANVPCVHIAVCARLEDIGLTARPVVRCYLFIYQVKTLYDDVWHHGTGCCDDQRIIPPDWEGGIHQNQSSFQTEHICWSRAAVELLIICKLIELRADFILIIKFTVPQLISQNCSLPQWFHFWHFSSALAEFFKGDAERRVIQTQRAKLGKCWASDNPRASVSGCVNTGMYVINASKGALYVQMICISE